MKTRRLLLTSINFFKNIDNFGVSYEPYIIKDSKKYQSPFGGLITTIIYILSFIYFVYLFDSWLNNELQAKGPQLDFFYTSSPITVDLIMYNKSALGNKKVFDVKVTNYIDQQEISSYNQSNDYSCNSRNGNYFQVKQSACLDMKKINNNIFKNSTYNYIVLYVLRCDPTESDNCASDEEINQALNMTGSLWFRITSLIEKYDFTKDQIQEYIQEDYIHFSLDETQVFYQLANVAQVSLDNGMLFQNIKKVSYVKDYRIYTNTFDIKYSKQLYFQRDCLLQVSLSLNSQISQIKIQNVKISEILAQISSIFDVIMLLKFLALFYNQEKLDYKLYNTIVNQNKDKRVNKISFFHNLLLKYNFGIKNNPIILSAKDQWDKELNFVLKKQNIFYQFKKMQSLELLVKQISSHQINDAQSSNSNLLKEQYGEKEIKVFPSYILDQIQQDFKNKPNFGKSDPSSREDQQLNNK